MPTYDYVCQGCGHRFQEFQRITADALTDCPACDEPVLKRLIGAGGGVIFKGSGFYVTDYARSNGRANSNACKNDAEPKSCGSCDDSGPRPCDPA